jgi:hypothetical protein
LGLVELLDAHAEAELAPEARHANFGLDLGDSPTQQRPSGSRAAYLEGDNDMARLLRWGAPFVELIDNATISPLLKDLLNPGGEFPSPGFRLDHVYATLLRPGTQSDPTLCGTTGWHSGPMSWPRSLHEYFRCDSGYFSTGLTVVAYELVDVMPGVGGMGAMYATAQSIAVHDPSTHH